TAGACRCAASAPRPMPAAARVRRRPWPARRRQVRSNAAPQPRCGRAEEGPPQGEEERRRGPGPHQEHVQQHDRLDHRPQRCRDRVGVRGPRRVQGLAQVHAVRGPDGRRERRAQGRRARHEEGGRVREGPRFRPGDRDPFAAGRRPRGRHDLRRHAAAAQRLPYAQAAAGLGEGGTNMARYTGPMTRKSRRLKVDLVGGDQAFERRPYPPGQHGRIRVKETEYLLQMQEKQKARYAYGVLEKQFRRYYDEANRRPGKTGDNLLQILESRLDNVVYRAGLARTRRMARQRVSHGHFLVNGEKVNIPSYRVAQYDIIDVRPKSLNMDPVIIAKETLGDRPVPAWLQVVPSNLRILVHQLPERAQIDTQVNEQLIVELYSK